MGAPVNEDRWEWRASISKTGAPGGGWLFEYHGGWAGAEDDTQAFKSLTWAKRYSPEFRWVKRGPNYWMGYVPKEEES